MDNALQRAINEHAEALYQIVCADWEGVGCEPGALALHVAKVRHTLEAIRTRQVELVAQSAKGHWHIDGHEFPAEMVGTTTPEDPAETAVAEAYRRYVEYPMREE